MRMVVPYWVHKIRLADSNRPEGDRQKFGQESEGHMAVRLLVGALKSALKAMKGTTVCGS
jgi:hypothetical protein